MSNSIKRGSTFYIVFASSRAEKVIDFAREIPAAFRSEEEAIDYAESEACLETGEADVIRCTPIKVVRDRNTRVSIEEYYAAAKKAAKEKRDE